jgi:hypothetical protein
VEPQRSSRAACSKPQLPLLSISELTQGYSLGWQ